MRFKKIQNLYKIYIKFLIKWTNIWKIIRLFYQFIKKQIKHTIAPVSDHEIWRLNQIEPSADVKTRTKHARTIANATCVRYHKSVTDEHKNFRSGDTSCFSQHQRLENAHIRPFDSNISVLSRHAINYRIIDYKRRTERVEHTVSFRRFQLNDWYRRPSIDRDLRNEKPFTRQKVTDNAKRDSRRTACSYHARGKRAAVQYWLSRSKLNRGSRFLVPLEFDGSRSGKCRSDQVVETSGTYTAILCATMFLALKAIALGTIDIVIILPRQK